MSTRFFERDLSFKKTGGDVPGDIFIEYSSENYSPDDMVNNGIILEYQNQNQPKYKACEKISFAWPLKLSLKCKKAVLKKMMPPRNRPLSQIAEEEGIVRPHCVIGVEKPDQKISWNLMMTQVLRDGMLGIKILHLVFAARQIWSLRQASQPMQGENSSSRRRTASQGIPPAVKSHLRVSRIPSELPPPLLGSPPRRGSGARGEIR